MLKDFKGIYADERPLIGFTCTDNDIQDIGVYLNNDNSGTICIDNKLSYWHKSDLQEFINNLQKVCNNMKMKD